MLLGDLTETGDPAALGEVAAWFDAFGTPVAAVAGNHDGDARDARLRCLASEPLTLGNITLAGLDAVPVADAARRFGAGSLDIQGGGSLAAVASHFPLVSLRPRLAAAGLPYPGDLVDGAAARARFAAVPGVALSGHVHARCSIAEGPLLQLSVGALIEPPFDCTVVTISDGEQPTVRRRATRLGERLAVDPVFAPADETWTWNGDHWSREAGAQAERSASQASTSAALRSGGKTG